MSYCKYVKELPADNVHKIYHDQHYGVMMSGDDEIFGRLILEINQAGLSWDTILKKEKNFEMAYDNYNIPKISKYNERDIERLMNDPGIIRNKLKINAAIHNANIIRNLKNDMNEVCTFKNWLLNNFNPTSHEASRDTVIIYNDKVSAAKYFKKSGFKFVGGEIVGEFLMSLGLLTGNHDADCKYYKR